MLFKKEGLKIKERWKESIDGNIYSDIVCDDITSDGKMEILFTTNKGILYCLDDKGKILWSFQLSAGKKLEQTMIDTDINRMVCASPIVVDIDDNGKKEVIIGSDDGKLYAINYKGEKIWDFETQGPIKSTAAVSDIDSDGKYEIVFGSDDSFVYALKFDGSLLWKFKTNDRVESAIVIDDINKDNDLEIVFGSDDNQIYALDYNGKMLWSFKTRDTVIGAPAIFDIDKDGMPEIIFGSGDCGIYVLKNDGKTVWKKQFSGRIVSEVITSELGQGRECIIFTSCSDKESLVVLDAFGNEIDSHQTSFWVTSAPIVFDIDNDGNKEIIFASTDNNIYILSAKVNVEGKIVLDERMPPFNVGSAVFGTPCLVDLYRDNRHFLIVGTEKGRIKALEIVY